jgi:predicted GNAT family acetyltransferase
MIEVQHHFDGKKGEFTYEPEGKRLAAMYYVLTNPNLMIIDHTEVDESLAGQGIGRKLLESLVGYVREKNIKVIPLCPFAKATFQKTVEWQDVLNQ